MEAVALDDKLPSPFLDKYEPQKGKADYMFICSPQKWRAHIHFSEQLKMSFHCFDGLCCKVFPQRNDYTIYLVGQYLDGRNAKSGLVLKYLRVGRQVDEAIRSIATQFEDPKKLTAIDLKVELDTTKPEKFKMLKITPCVDGKRMAGKEALLDLKEQIKVFLPNLESSIARPMDEKEFINVCEQNDIDISEFTEEAPAKTTMKKSKIQTPEDEVEPEVEEVEEEPELELSEEEADELMSEIEDEAEIEEVEEKPAPKKTTTKAPKKQKAEDIPELDDAAFDLDSLL